MKYYSPLILGFIALCTTTGCIEKPTRSTEYAPFETVEYDAVLSIVVDLSGSFHADWQRDGRAHKLFLDLMDQFFTESMGAESRVLLSQISNSDSIVLFDGTPQELANRFRSPESLNHFLAERSDPSGSKVYQSTKRMFEYLNELNGVTDNTRVLTVVLSDLKDSQTDREQWQKAGRAMLESLKIYAKSGGGIALYFVAEEEKPRWRKIMDLAEFKPGSFVIEGQLTESPQLPSFE
ncbi:MAG: hypothetical protein AAGA30_00135 [Planctomycetota bacterium]